MKLVVKLSGKVLEEKQLREALCLQIAELVQQGTRLVLIHGGGKQLSRLCERLGIPVIQHDGRRVTDADTLEAAKMVFSAINRDLTASLTAFGVKAVGLSAFDGFLTRARRRPPISINGDAGSGSKKMVDFGLVAEITEVDTSLVETLWNASCVPVVSCLCADATGQILNINADTLGAELALALGADRLISVSDVEGIYADPKDKTTLIPSLSLEQAQRYLEGGVFLDGMIPKVQTAVGVLRRGLSSFQILSGVREQSLLEGLRNASGTLISR